MHNVYIVSCGTETKIGIAKDVASRVSSLQTGNSKKVALQGVVTTKNKGDSLAIEKELHARYEKAKVIGEWFNVPFSEIIEDCKGKYDFVLPVIPYTIFGNGKETRNGGKSMDILDVCKELNTAEMNLMQFIRDEIERNKVNKEANVNLIKPTKSDDWNDYLAIGLKKNYPHMNCMEIIRRVKRGTYMVNPNLFIPPADLNHHLVEWNALDKGCDDE